jgi:protein Mpv17
MGGGDAMAQLSGVEHYGTGKYVPFDSSRTARFAFLGTFLMGPSLHFWYGYLARTFPLTGGFGTVLQVFKRVVADQFLFAPAIIAVFFTSVAALENRISTLPDQFRQKYVLTVEANWAFWIPVQLFNFAFVPLPFQVLVNNAFGLFWNAFLTLSSQPPISSVPVELEIDPIA